MPSLDFKGKQFVYTHHLSVPFREIVPDAKKSVGKTPGGAHRWTKAGHDLPNANGRKLAIRISFFLGGSFHVGSCEIAGAQRDITNGQKTDGWIRGSLGPDRTSRR